MGHNIKQILDGQKTSLSFEFFPPKSEKASNVLLKSIKDLMPLRPSFVSVTYGAGGSTRDLTHDLLLKLIKETDIDVVSHLTCVGHTKDEVKNILQQYDDSGIQNIMALRGDPPVGESTFKPIHGGFSYASELVSFVKKHFPHMGVGVAGFPEGHPDCPNRLKEMDYLKAKVDEGADYICTQLFFDNHDFYDFQERCEINGINIPIVAGLMPISSIKGMQRMADLAGGARFPAKLLKALARAENDDYVEKVGTHWASQQAMDLINHDVKGIHFYTLNKSDATRKIYESLGLKTTHALNEYSL